MLCKAPQILNMQKHFKGMHTESAQSIPSAAAAAAAALVLVREPLLQHLPRAAAAQPLAPSDMRLAESITIMLLSSSSVAYRRCLGTTSQSPNSCRLEAPQCLLAQHANPLAHRPAGFLLSSLLLCMKLLVPLKSELLAKPLHLHFQLCVLRKCMDE